MKDFAILLDRLALEQRRNAKVALIGEYLRHTPDPERGYALAALTGSLTFRHAKSSLIRELIRQKVDPVLFALSYDYVGDLSETVALLWPCANNPSSRLMPTLASVVETLASTGKMSLPALLSDWLDQLEPTGRWALLKLITGGLRVGVSARLAKTAVAELGAVDPDEIEKLWHGLSPPYDDLFSWIEGRGSKPNLTNSAPFRPPMLAHSLEERDFDTLDPQDFMAEWKWDGIRVQAVAGRDAAGERIARLYSRSGEDLSAAFPDLLDALPFDGAVDGELLILRAGQVQSFNVLQQRLNRKLASARLLADFPAHIRVYDLLADGAEDVRDMPLRHRRARLEALTAGSESPRLSLSPLIAFASWEELARARAQPGLAGAGPDANAVEGCMIKRRDSLYLPGRPKGHWFKWKHDPLTVDAVLMYAQRGHGKRSSYYSDFTFGVWRETLDSRELVPVGKAYFGFTDEELVRLDRFVRRNTVDRHGPVRVVKADADAGLVLEVAFDGLNRSTRHKSGLAMRFPRISRIRWDKPIAEADTLASLEKRLHATDSPLQPS